MVVMVWKNRIGALDYCQAPFGSWGQEDPYVHVGHKGPYWLGGA